MADRSNKCMPASIPVASIISLRVKRLFGAYLKALRPILVGPAFALTDESVARIIAFIAYYHEQFYRPTASPSVPVNARNS